MVAAPQVIIPKFPPQDNKAFWHSLMRQVIHGEGLEKLREKQEITRIAQREQYEKRKTVDGLGQLKAEIPITTYLRWHHAQPGCWADKSFRKEFYRDNKELLAARPEKKYY